MNKYDHKYQKKEATKVNLDQVKSNDPAWYNKNSINYNAATATPWVMTVGDNLPISKCITKGGASFTPLKDSAFANLMVLDVVTGPGYAEGPMDPPNVAFSQLMADIYSKTSSSTVPFQQADVAMYVTSLDSIIYMIANAKRVLLATKFWRERNAYYPRALVKALGFDYDDLTQHTTEYRSTLNNIIIKFNNLNVLDTFDLYHRHYSMFRNVYLDEDSELGQIYMFRPANYYVYSDKDSKCTSYLLGGRTVLQSDSYTFTNFMSYLTLISNCIDAWLNSQDLYMISGYLKRAYGNAVQFSISQVEEPEVLEPVADDEWITAQIMNAIINEVDATTLDITQIMPSGNVKWMPKTIHKSATGSYYAYSGGVMVRAYQFEPSNDYNMESTRLASIPSNWRTEEDEHGAAYTVGDFVGCGPEMVTGISIVNYNRYNNTIGVDSLYEPIISFSTATGISNAKAVAFIIAAQPFRYIPNVPLIEVASQTLKCMIGDVYNYTYFSAHALYELNKVALFSLYRIVE